MKKTVHDDIPVVDKIVRICSGLNNFCLSVVPLIESVHVHSLHNHNSIHIMI